MVRRGVVLHHNGENGGAGQPVPDARQASCRNFTPTGATPRQLRPDLGVGCVT